jgi:putative ABC transport system permease protein
MFRLGYRNLFQSRTRLMVSVGGVALALMLILSLDGILAGSERRMTAYIDNTGADIFVAQSGVRNMHMASSSLPRSVLGEVKSIEGILDVTPILYLTNVIDVGDQQFLAYIIGVDPEANFGGAWELAAGRSTPSAGEIVIDETVATRAGLSLGDEVNVLGQPFDVVGTAKGTTSMINSVAFIALEDFFGQRGTEQTISYLLATVLGEESPEVIAERIESNVSGVTAMARGAFSGEEAQIIQDMGSDIIAIMNGIGFLIGVAVTALTIYTATLSRKAEYGMLKALGAKNSDLYATVGWQTAISIGLGLIVAVGLTLGLTVFVPLAIPELEMLILPNALAKAAIAAAGIGLLAAMIPVWQITRVDPATVFRR